MEPYLVYSHGALPCILTNMEPYLVYSHAALPFLQSWSPTLSTDKHGALLCLVMEHYLGYSHGALPCLLSWSPTLSTVMEPYLVYSHRALPCLQSWSPSLLTNMEPYLLSKYIFILQILTLLLDLNVKYLSAFKIAEQPSVIYGISSTTLNFIFWPHSF
ncbi:hypothetical protein Btru_048919 [Bulinus truncatus]|nr:hypothetical protein Btru_048919 [Bulinus truncatus]